MAVPLENNGKLCAAIDFGQLDMGDPACDLVIAWTLFTTESRNIFRAALNHDKDTIPGHGDVDGHYGKRYAGHSQAKNVSTGVYLMKY